MDKVNTDTSIELSGPINHEFEALVHNIKLCAKKHNQKVLCLRSYYEGQQLNKQFKLIKLSFQELSLLWFAKNDDWVREHTKLQDRFNWPEGI